MLNTGQSNKREMKQNYIVNRYADQLKSTSVKSLTVMLLFQLADDKFSEFRRLQFVKDNYSRAKVVEVAEVFNGLRRKLKNSFRQSGTIELYDEMMEDIANHADELQEDLETFNVGIRTILTQCMSFCEVEPFAMCVTAGTLLLLANDAFSFGSQYQCRYFCEAARKMDDLLCRVELWKNIHHIGDDAIAERIFAKVVNIAVKEVGQYSPEPKQPLLRTVGYRNHSGVNDYLDGIAREAMRLYHEQ